MRVNIYAEEMTDRIEIISKKIEGQKFTGLRIYLELPVTMEQCAQCGNIRPVDGVEYTVAHGAWDTDLPAPSSCECGNAHYKPIQLRGPFMHHPGDDDSSAVTFWGKEDLREVLRKALVMLDEFYEQGRRK